MPATVSHKIITTLRDRRQIEAEVRRLPACHSEPQLRQQAQLIAEYGSQVIPVLVGHLNAADGRLLAALGVLSTLLDREQVVPALREAVKDPARTDQGRIAAMTILERFLGEPPGDDLVGSLSDPRAAALAVLEDILAQAGANRAVLAEYVQGLDRQQPDVVLSVVHALRAAGDERAVEPLRMIAQDVRAEIAAEALTVLGSLRTPAAAAALQTLIPVAAPELLSLAERMLRKLQFCGVPVAALPLPDAGCRALLSPPDGLGQQMLSFIQGTRRPGLFRYLTVLLSDRLGAIDAAGRDGVAAWELPSRGQPGRMREISPPGAAGRQLMVDVSFDAGRRVLRDCLAYNRATQVPLAASLRLLHPWLWGLGGSQALPAPCLPQPAAAGLSPAQAESLLRQPAFRFWIEDEEGMAGPASALELWTRRLCGQPLSDPETVEVLRRRLTSMSEWLLWAGNEPDARLALAAARSLTVLG